MNDLWAHGRMPHVEAWFERVRSRPAFAAAIERWMPETLAAEMQANGQRAWPRIEALIGADQPTSF